MQDTFAVVCEYYGRSEREAFDAQCTGWLTEDDVSLPGDLADWIPHHTSTTDGATWKGVLLPKQATDAVTPDPSSERLVLRLDNDEVYWADIEAIAREPRGAKRLAFVIVGRGRPPLPLRTRPDPAPPDEPSAATSDAESRIADAIGVVDDLLATDHSALEEGFLLDLRDDLERLRQHVAHRDVAVGRVVIGRLRRLASHFRSVRNAGIEVLKIASHLETAADAAASFFAG